jgi:ABC-type phosphate/phosphonate transport system substrate-binding protein
MNKTGRRDWMRCAAGAACAGALRGEHQNISARIGLSGSMLGDVNLNDARAAIRVWMDTITRQTGIGIVYDPPNLFDTSYLMTAIRAGTMDVFGITLNEYREVAALVDPTAIVLDEVTSHGQEYLILAHRDRGITKMADLRGRQLVVLKSPVTSLVNDWLETLMVDGSLGPADRFFSQVTWNVKLSKVVLPVYFQQADACLAIASGFATMCELNPQLATRLTVVARSPRLVPSLIGFHKSFAPTVRNTFCQGLLSLHDSPSGRQALSLFQSRRLVGAEASVLRSSLEMAGAAARLRAAASPRKTR